MIGFIFIGTLLGWIAAGAVLVSGAGFLLALGACVGVGCGTTVAGAALTLALTLRSRDDALPVSISA